MKVMTFDPGKLSVGWATADENGIVRCGLVSDKTQPGLLRKLRDMQLDKATRGIKVFIEVPQIYRERDWRGDPNDLVDETITVGALAAFTLDAEQEFKRPHDWKGNVPKSIHNRRVKSRLTLAEAGVLANCGVIPSLAHNVVDAIGMCLWSLGRLS
jgi:hypothetical protein